MVVYHGATGEQSLDTFYSGGGYSGYSWPLRGIGGMGTAAATTSGAPRRT